MQDLGNFKDIFTTSVEAHGMNVSLNYLIVAGVVMIRVTKLDRVDVQNVVIV